jgi:hypothetical protein
MMKIRQNRRMRSTEGRVPVELWAGGVEMMLLEMRRWS